MTKFILTTITLTLLLIVFKVDAQIIDNLLPEGFPTYEIIENIRAENHELLKADLEKRLGIEILSFEVGNVNFLRDVAKITVYYEL